MGWCGGHYLDTTNMKEEMTMHKLAALAVTVTAAATMALTSGTALAATPTPTPSQFTPQLSLLAGGVDVDRYCQQRGYSGATLDNNTAYGWNCFTQTGQRAGISMTDACHEQYGPDFIDRLANYNNPYSWQCVN
jgi:hypothetical protein